MPCARCSSGCPCSRSGPLQAPAPSAAQRSFFSSSYVSSRSNALLFVFHPSALFLYRADTDIVYRIFRRCTRHLSCAVLQEKPRRGFSFCAVCRLILRFFASDRPQGSTLGSGLLRCTCTKQTAVSVQRPATRVLAAQVLHLPGQHIAGAPAAHAVRFAPPSPVPRGTRPARSTGPRPLRAGTPATRARCSQRQIGCCRSAACSHSPSRSAGRDNPPPVLPRPQPATPSHRCTGC